MNEWAGGQQRPVGVPEPMMRPTTAPRTTPNRRKAEGANRMASGVKGKTRGSGLGGEGVTVTR